MFLRQTGGAGAWITSIPPRRAVCDLGTGRRTPEHAAVGLALDAEAGQWAHEGRLGLRGAHRAVLGAPSASERPAVSSHHGLARGTSSPPNAEQRALADDGGPHPTHTTLSVGLW